ncbi:MAG: aldehyde dehydrogenase family protein [Verrucomicrobia bacterium]|nr:aldehyde dehydrogenase family protein [Verrucomicrobiota bacterium]
MLPEIPILRLGKVYQSLDLQLLKAVATGEAVAKVSFANDGLVKGDLRRMDEARDVLRKVPCQQLLEITAKAGEIFLNDTLPLGADGSMQSPDDYLRQLAATSGLPHTLIRMNMQRLGNIFGEVGTILQGLTRGLDVSILDRGYGEQSGVPVSFNAVTNCLGVIMPSNSPAVNALWIPAIAMKIPVIIKPGREEPWTPWRVIQAFIKAGCPPEAFSYYPTSHEGSGAIIRRAGRVMLFGDDSTVAQHTHDPRIEVHGSGRSKILIGEDKIEHWRDYLDVMIESVSANSGRSCINTSTIVVPKYADEIAKALAEALVDMRPLAANDPAARLSGFANPQFAEWISEAIDTDLETKGARDVSATVRVDERFQTRDGMHYLLPTVTRCDSFEHPLSNKEYLFPFASVVELDQASMLDQIGPSLVVTAITEDQDWITRLLECPDIDRLNVGAHPTNRVQWNQPHEGNLFEFLYRRRAIQIAV